MRCVLIAFLLALASTSSSFAQNDGDIVAARSAELVERIADSHPRLLIRPVDVPALRSFFKELRRQSDGAAQAKAIMPPLDARALTPEPKAVKNGTPEGTRQWQAGFKAANEAGSWAQRYALVWLLSEDPAYGRDAPIKRSFWRNTPYFGVYGLMSYPGSSFGDLTNSMPPSGSIRLLMEKFARLNGDPYPLAFARVLSNTLPSDFNYFTYDASDYVSRTHG
jgi:hypothetical protein